ncbi:peptide chain release factor 1 [Sodalis sp. CWE]|uniref:peptide chain release factor 1 n=1 Tax=Sodalis sp. CWE TaxID=2803816 RepID=UPI001C7D96A4|nr:peptide chain release factor 1 [Sodalis sp. CWE]MBX4180912.1 peptide chain release factor 1 [Sodalis sp. CWE]
MKYSVITKLNALRKRCKEVEILLRKPEVIFDQVSFRTLSKEYVRLFEITCHFKNWKQTKENIRIAKYLLQDPEMKGIAQEEICISNLRLEQIENQLRTLLLPEGKDDKRGCFLEIRAATGGNEAALFANNLFRMYSRYFESKGWKTEVINISYGERGGFKEVIIKVAHKGAYGLLKFESGGHRVQRIPETESQGRVHSSTCTVAVTPEMQKVELLKINPGDLRVDTFRSSGAGGQHVNTTDSAIRVTHLPTGLVAECQDERSQHKNRAKALEVLGSRLRAAEVRKRQQEESTTRRNLLGSGDRSDRIRTYNFPQGRITDHRVNLTLYKLNEIIDGKLDILIQPLIQKYQSDQLVLLCKNL